jgi:catechol 2,3-dioxygenase-like lactoylglutathione lyase family enzyme
MKPKSISGIITYVTNIEATAAFYETLGFRFGERTETYIKAYINWFWIEFYAKGEESAIAQDNGRSVQLSVDDVDAYHSYLVEQGLQPSTDPVDEPTGRRSFTIQDPDGYSLTFFHKK